MAESKKPRVRARSIVARSAAIAGLAIAAVGVTAPTSFAGTSGNVYGCYSTWGSTGSNAHCQMVQRQGNFQNQGSCNLGGTVRSGWNFFSTLQSVPNWGQVDCTFAIDSSWVNYTNG